MNNIGNNRTKLRLLTPQRYGISSDFANIKKCSKSDVCPELSTYNKT